MIELVWTRNAEADIQQIYESFDSFSEGGGERFLKAVESSLILLARFPGMGSSYSPPVRRLLISNQAFGLFYTSENRGVIIHAIASMREDPDIIARKLKHVTR